MRILIYGINFLPEPVGIGKYTGEMACWLSERGHAVRMVCAPPYYPDWKIQSPFKATKFTKDQHGSIDVFRSPVWVPRKPRGLTRLIHLGSFAASSTLPLANQLSWRPDVVFTVAPALFCAPAALAFAKLSGSLSWLHIQDFEVDAAFDLGLLRHPKMESFARTAESRLLQEFDVVSTISPRMIDRLEQKGIAADRRVLFPNWVDCDEIFPMREPSSFRKELGIRNDAIVAMYSGALGEKQGIEILIEAAQLLRDHKEIVFVVGSSGPAFERFKAQSRHLTNMRCCDLAPPERLNDWLNIADVHLMPQRANAADLVMPSKLTGMLASGRPVVATAMPGTQVAQTVAQCGIFVTPGSTRDFAKAIVDLASHESKRIDLGRKGRAMAENQLGKDAVCGEFEQTLQAALDKHKPSHKT